MIHGLPKLQDIPNTQNSFMNMGLPPELAVIIGLLEFIGGMIDIKAKNIIVRQ